jgi:hypothetical protein
VTGFELCQIVLGDSFPHYVHAGFWARLRWRRHGRTFVFERVNFLRDFLDAFCGLFQPIASAAAILGDELDASHFEGRANCLDGSFLKFFARLKPDDSVRADASGRG